MPEDLAPIIARLEHASEEIMDAERAFLRDLNEHNKHFYLPIRDRLLNAISEIAVARARIKWMARS